jgi:hypothetical protein
MAVAHETPGMSEPMRGLGEVPLDASLAYLFDQLARVETRVRIAVDRRRAQDPDPDDRFRGLYIAESQVDEMLAGPRRLLEPIEPTYDIHEPSSGVAESATESIRLRRVARTFGLSAVDVDILLVALAPDLDPRFERLYAYLQDDVSRRRASTGLALELATGVPGAAAARTRLAQSAPLVQGGLLLVEEGERPFLTRSLRVPDRVAGHLLSNDAPDPRLAALAVEPRPLTLPDGTGITRARQADVRLFYVRERFGSAGIAMAAAALGADGTAPIVLDLARMAVGDDAAELAAVAARECLLTGAALIAGPVEVIAERGAASVRAFAEVTCPVVLLGSRQWDPAWSRGVPVLIDAPVPSLADRARVWHEELGLAEGGLDPATEMLQFRLSPEQTVRAARAASQQATAEGRALSADDLKAGARSQNAAGLERLSRRVRPLVTWDDLVLPEDVSEQLRELASRARFRDVVLDTWGMGRTTIKGRGLTALFAGDSGTGKTMSAEVMAADLGLDLYVIDLSTVIDKYVGETEKNLDRIFSEADRVNGVLLFDEADAVFGKRSDVKDSHDRYANVEVAYLLQRMELFDGVAILTTNLRANLDEAFTRRLDAVVDFPVPDDDGRLHLWEKHLPPDVPRGDDLDLGFLSRQFKLSGGNIRNIALAGAYLAAAEDNPLSMAHLIHGTAREYQKLGRMCVESEFGPYYDLVAG